MDLASKAISFLSHAGAAVPNSSTTHYFCHCTKGDIEPRITVSIYDFGFWPKLKGSEKKKKREWYPFLKVLGHLSLRCWCTRKFTRVPVSIEKPDSRELYLGGLAVHWGESPVQKPRGIRNWGHSGSLAPHLPKPLLRRQQLQEEEEDWVAKICVCYQPVLSIIPAPTEAQPQKCSFNTPGKYFGPLMRSHDSLRRVTELLPAKRN